MVLDAAINHLLADARGVAPRLNDLIARSVFALFWFPSSGLGTQIPRSAAGRREVSFPNVRSQAGAWERVARGTMS